MSKVIVLDRQSIQDIAIQHSGSVDADYAISVANGISITDDLPKEITIVEPINKNVVGYYKTNNIIPATSMELN